MPKPNQSQRERCTCSSYLRRHSIISFINVPAVKNKVTEFIKINHYGRVFRKKTQSANESLQADMQGNIQNVFHKNFVFGTAAGPCYIICPPLLSSQTNSSPGVQSLPKSSPVQTHSAVCVQAHWPSLSACYAHKQQSHPNPDNRSFLGIISL